MSEQLDSYLMSIGFALSRKEVEVDGAMQMLSAPEIINRVNGSNVQQLIRLSIMTMRFDESAPMIAEVGVLLTIIKPELEIDFGLSIGVASAQSCALFAMHTITLELGNIPAALATLQNMISSLRIANDRKGLLEVLCRLGVMYDDLGDYPNAAGALSAAIALLDDPETADTLLDNSAQDMVRADNQNVFSFPMLRILQLPQSTEMAAALRDLLRAVEAKR
jgi:tetratricopeptide (TPR) repeat protein